MRGQMNIGSLAAIGIMFTVAVVLLSVGADVVDEVRQSQCTSWNTTSYDCNDAALSYAYNVSGSGLEGTETLGDWLPTIATIVGAAIIIGVIAKGFGR